MSEFSAPTLDYFSSHAIDPEVAWAAGVRNGAAGIVYPCRDANGAPTTRTRRLNGAEPKVIGEAGAQLGVTAWRAPKAGGMVLVTEGESDALAACSAHPEVAVVSIPGCGFPADRLTGSLYGLKVAGVVLALDADRAGDAFASKAAPLLAQSGVQVRRLRLKPGQDLADALAAQQPDERAAWLAQAIREGESVEATPTGEDAVTAIRRALFDEAQDTRDASGPARDPVRGTGDLLHRGVGALFFGDRGGGKSTVALAVTMGATAAGERVLYLDRENGAALTRDRIRDVLEAHPEWVDPLADGRLAGRHYPDLNLGWAPAAYGEAIAGLGYTVAIYDSWREFLSVLHLDPDRETDISKFLALAVTPLLRRNLAVALLDNVGHEATHRPKGSGSKLDALPQAYKITTTSRFSEVEQGRVVITCSRSRYGDLDREWSMRVGGGVWDVPSALSEAPDARRAREIAGKRERFRLACIEVLREESPLGVRLLLPRVRERGAGGKTDVLKEWLADLSSDPASGIESTPDGYALGCDPDDRGHTGVTPPPDPCDPVTPGLKGVTGQVTVTPDPGGTGVTPLEDALDELAETLDGEWISEPVIDRATTPLFDLDAYREVRALYVHDQRHADEPAHSGYWRTGPGHPGVTLDDAERGAS
jgi:hypothetical protein